MLGSCRLVDGAAVCDLGRVADAANPAMRAVRAEVVDAVEYADSCDGAVRGSACAPDPAAVGADTDGADSADAALLAYTDRVPGECVDYKIVEQRKKDNYAVQRPWRSDTFEIVGGAANKNARIKGYCTFRAVNPCPCDTRTYTDTLTESNKARGAAGQPLCGKTYFAPGCGPYDVASFVRVDGAAEQDTGWSCVASDYQPNNGAADPYRGRVAVTVSRNFPSVKEANENGFGFCRPVTTTKISVDKKSKRRTATSTVEQLCSQTPVAFSDSLALTERAAPLGVALNYPQLTAFSGTTMKAYPVHAIISQRPMRDDGSVDANARGVDVRAADLPACKASGANVTVSYGNSLRIRMEPSDPNVKNASIPVDTASAVGKI